MKFMILLGLVVLTTQHPRVSPSGYGNNNAGDVQYAAGKSPHNKPVDYTSGTGDNSPKYVKPVGGSAGSYRPPHDTPTYAAILVPNYNVIGNKIDSQNLGQINTQGQQNVQKGGDQTNVGANANQVNVGQANTQGGAVSGYRPSYDVPTYAAVLIPNYNVIGNKFDSQTLGQINTQGQQNIQKGGDQTNVGANANQVNVGQTNTQGGASGSYRPSYDVPTYAAVLIPNYNVVGNKIDAQTLGQINTQGQQNVQKGGDQTNVGLNANQVNVGQANTQGSAGGRYQPSYDVPTYAAILIPNYNVVGNRYDVQNLGQVSNQGQQNVQKGGDQTNVGANANQVNVGQANTQGGPAGGYRPSYDVPTYAAVLIPNYNVNTQGQTSIQKGGDQTNVGSNANAVNVGQVNNQGKAGAQPSYDAPRNRGPTTIAGNKVKQQNLGQYNNQGQRNYQQGGAQTNLGYNKNVVNVSQSNTQSVGGQNSARTQISRPALVRRQQGGGVWMTHCGSGDWALNGGEATVIMGGVKQASSGQAIFAGTSCPASVLISLMVRFKKRRHGIQHQPNRHGRNNSVACNVQGFEEDHPGYANKTSQRNQARRTSRLSFWSTDEAAVFEASLDIEAAFDSPLQGRLLNALRAILISGKFVHLISDMDRRTTAAVRTPTGCTTPFEV
ncbi:hypothetical protein RB195_002929 [Necator americanus]|uniref:Uncharacterized protein n=1 Tax=Necator americanus TaxID=51031 RepID=A0ABR1DLB4_NECAM